jgi:hypothetical protein
MITEDLFPTFPFVFLQPQDENILKDIVQRSMLVKSFVKVYSEGDNYEELIKNVNLEEMNPFLEDKAGFCVVVDARDRSYK